jgi:hypothetical protein
MPIQPIGTPLLLSRDHSAPGVSHAPRPPRLACRHQAPTYSAYAAAAHAFVAPQDGVIYSAANVLDAQLSRSRRQRQPLHADGADSPHALAQRLFGRFSSSGEARHQPRPRLDDLSLTTEQRTSLAAVIIQTYTRYPPTCL